MLNLRLIHTLVIAALIAVASPAAFSLQAQETGPDLNFNFDEGEEFANFGEDDFSNDLDPEVAAAAATGIILCYGVAILVGLIVQIFICYLLYDALSAVPDEYRELETWVPWLLLVPFVNLVVMFLAFIKVPRSLAKALAAGGNTSLGDCGEKMGLWAAILTLIPCANIVGLVLMILTLLKIGEAKKALRAAA